MAIFLFHLMTKVSFKSIFVLSEEENSKDKVTVLIVPAGEKKEEKRLHKSQKIMIITCNFGRKR